MSLPKDRDASLDPAADEVQPAAAGAEECAAAVSETGVSRETGKPKTSSAGLVVVTVLLVALVAAGAWFQEPITYFFKLRAWDRSAPAQTVSAFLAAARAGDQQGAQQHITGRDLNPLLDKGGKWIGYTGRYGTISTEARLKELVPDGEPAPVNTQFVYLGRGSATVTMPAAKGALADYRLEQEDGKWKVLTLRLQPRRSVTPPPPRAPSGAR